MKDITPTHIADHAKAKAVDVTDRPLTDRALRFIEHIVSTGCSGAEAAVAVGYAEGSSRTQAYRLLNDQRVLDAMHQATKRKLAVSGVRAAEKMLSLATGARSERVQMEASKDLLDRGGYGVSNEASVTGISISIDLGD
jgi:phage terminase small subunit